MAVLFKDVCHRKDKTETSTIAKASKLCHVAYEEFLVSFVSTKVIVVSRCSKCLSDS